ncbi:WD40/YVTN/BNR-like repeat-containing protein [Massilia cavernae]|uniref:WD40/YVTN/BNR-like repeat-containing protein n=1 Tax=Massilia cavernae TaxID=2320864 RepID=UPI001C71AF4A
MIECVRKTASAILLAALSGAACAAASFPALDRPAVQVKAPERQVLLAAAQAGTRVVAVGERGLVVLSDDAGASWRQARAVPVSTTLTAVSFRSAQLGWAVGHGGVVLHTRDGGDTWTRQADGASLARARCRPQNRRCARRPAVTRRSGR